MNRYLLYIKFNASAEEGSGNSTGLQDESLLLYDQNKVTMGWATSLHRASAGGSWISI